MTSTGEGEGQADPYAFLELVLDMQEAAGLVPTCPRELVRRLPVDIVVETALDGLERLNRYRRLVSEQEKPRKRRP